MARPVTVLVSTLLFALLGLLIGWLSIRAEIDSNPLGVRLSDQDFLLSFGVAPIAGALFGGGLAVFVIWLFMPPKTRD